MSRRMVAFPLEKRGEAVHAIRDRHLVFQVRQEVSSLTATQCFEYAGLESGHGASAGGCRCSDLRHSSITWDFAEDVGELETAMVEAPAFRTRGCAPRRAATSDVEGAGTSASAGGAKRPAPAGIRLQQVDGAAPGGIRHRAYGCEGYPGMDHRVASQERLRLEENQAHDAQPAKPAEYRKGLESPPEAKKRALEPGAQFELWFADGVRFELLPVTVYTYRKRGRPLLISTPGKNKKVAVCGAMRWPDGPFVFSDGSGYPNTSLFVRMLQRLKIRARRTGRRIVLVLDNGSAHTSRLSRAEIDKVKGLIQVFWLPTYTSEQLNDIEGLWKHLKEDYFSRMLVDNSQDFREAVVGILKRMSRARGLRRVLKPCHVAPMRKNLVVPA